jgi:hypothetical protein
MQCFHEINRYKNKILFSYYTKNQEGSSLHRIKKSLEHNAGTKITYILFQDRCFRRDEGKVTLLSFVLWTESAEHKIFKHCKSSLNHLLQIRRFIKSKIIKKAFTGTWICQQITKIRYKSTQHNSQYEH